MADACERYLARRGRLDRWPLVWTPGEPVASVVVIPCFAEHDYLFATLDTLAANPETERARTLVVCVVNNRAEPHASPEHIADNQATLEALRERLDDAGALLRLGYINASSPGRELPEKGGVGLARKLGLDAGLAVLHDHGASPRILCSLDADTWVEPTYLEAVHRHFAESGAWAAVVPYAHRLDGPPAQVEAIICYEIYLRYYVFGLRYAGSPYAYHSIGSTMACRDDAYVAAGGMNERQAGEDFYFLQELAKTGGMGQVAGTTVHPSSRPSFRVPFGTGQKVRGHLAGTHDAWSAYDPRVFAVLRAWLDCAREAIATGSDILPAVTDTIEPQLTLFLARLRFEQVWSGLRANSRTQAQLNAQFHRWFDGFRTLKLVHHLRDTVYPNVGLFDAVNTLRGMSGECEASAEQALWELMERSASDPRGSS